LGIKHSNRKAYGYLLERTQKKVRQYFQKALLAHDAGITVDQWIILDRLNRNHGLSQSEIADMTFKDAPTVTRIIDLLCKKELVKRIQDNGDRRRLNINLTAQGRRKVEEVSPIVLEMREKGWQNLSDEDYTTMIRILDTIYTNFNGR
jgi:DNA-binding MarR family transcriptional regulator